MKSLSRQTLLLWAFAIGMVLLASILGRPDIPIDETRYVSVAWEMRSGGDWLVMHINGQPYHHKPPLLFWLINLGWQVFGVNDWWPRCISALFSLLSAIATAEIAQRLWPRSEGVATRAGWILLSGIYWLFFSSAVMFDVMLTAFVLLALLGLLQVRQADGWRGWSLFGLAMGLGMLAKGPAILLIVMPVAMLGPWWGGNAVSARRWYVGLAFGTLLGTAIALAWVVPAALRGGEEYGRAMFWSMGGGRVAGSFHSQPIWFYLAASPLLLFPVILWPGFWQGMRASLRLRGDVGVRFCLSWIVPAFIGFSAAGGKQPHYLLPLLPAVAMLVATGLPREEGRKRWSWLPLAAVTGLAGIGLLVSPFWVGKFWLAAHVGLDWAVAGVLIMLLACLPALRGIKPALRIGLFSTALAVIISLFVLRPLSPVFDVTPMAMQLQRLEQQGTVVAHASAYNDQYQFYGRLTRPLIEIGRNDILQWFEKNPDGRVVAYLKSASSIAVVRPEFSQPYLGGAVVLVDAVAARRLP